MDKVYLITGGSSGIGLAVAEKFIKNGDKVISVTRSEKKIVRAYGEKPHLEGVVDFFTGDISKQEDVDKVVDYLKENYGVLHGLVNSAGVLSTGTLESLTVEQWHQMLDINLTGPFLLTKALLPFLKRAGGASIVNISSIAGLRPGTSIGYSVSKAGLDMLTRFLAGDLGPYNIRVNSINPGLVRTNLHFDNDIIDDEKVYEEMIEAAKVRHPLKRIGEPQDIANAVDFLMSDAASWISGVIMPVDGAVTQENSFLPPKDS
ncbi:SDR family NAD(P)-dependent oxidoreductase [Marinilabiliaceae bacterium ANBcel2]|nr:SDR family NAD(P)-dependent oxidoreductase [Marinilabiliaceae bacterium ANBcel2]